MSDGRLAQFREAAMKAHESGRGALGPLYSHIGIESSDLIALLDLVEAQHGALSNLVGNCIVETELQKECLDDAEETLALYDAFDKGES